MAEGQKIGQQIAPIFLAFSGFPGRQWAPFRSPSRPTSSMLDRAMNQPLPIRERAAITVPVAVQFSGLSRSRLFELMAAKDIESRMICGRRLIMVPSLLEFLGED